MIANPKNQQTPESQSLASIAFGISLEESLYPSHETLHEFLDQAPAPPPAIIINSSLLDPRNLLHGDERRPLNFPCKSIYTQGSSHGLVTRLTNSLPPPSPRQAAMVTSRELSTRPLAHFLCTHQFLGT